MTGTAELSKPPLRKRRTVAKVRSMKRNASTLAIIGTALYGPNWQTPLSIALEVSDRTVRYWVEGRAIPDGVWADIAELCRARAAALDELAGKLDA